MQSAKKNKETICVECLKTFSNLKKYINKC